MSDEVNTSPKTPGELLAVIEGIVGNAEALWEQAKSDDAENPYGTEAAASGYEASADAMWQAALAAFNYAASVVGASGFQASWAALHFYGRAMSIDGPFAMFKGDDLLYPQYDLRARLEEWISSDDMTRWLAEEAQKKLNDHDPEFASPRVVGHWRSLVEKGLALADAAATDA